MNLYTQQLTANNSSSYSILKVVMIFKKTVKSLLSKVKKESPVLYWVAGIISIIGLGCAIGLIFDHRNLKGVNVWLKPFKFAISIAIYLITLGYLITKYPYSSKKKNIINHITAWSLLLEFLIIVYQASRGVQSHYNTSSAFNGILFMLMGVFVGINVLTMILFIIDTARLKLKTTKSVQWAIFLGWVIIVFGSWVGGQMISQMAHSVAVPDGEAGLPLVNWSTRGGDLRIAHFFALHSIQIIPLFAIGLSRQWKFSERNQIIMVTIFGLLFASWIGFIFYQAKQGIPLIAL